MGLFKVRRNWCISKWDCLETSIVIFIVIVIIPGNWGRKPEIFLRVGTYINHKNMNKAINE